MLYILSIVFISIGLLLFIFNIFMSKRNNNFPKIKNNYFDICILIPARDESKVIEGLLNSIRNQKLKINMKDVYVIVEDIKDPTVEIVKNYNGNIFVRKNLDLKRKGYALDEAIKDILKTKKYDAYFIFDADNILDENYFVEMKKTYLNGYDIGISYRNSKNGNFNLVSASSTLTFSMINTIGNLSKNKHSGNVIISGTGFYINGNIINKLKCFPFNSLTEDYEFTLYSILNEYTTYYNTKAIIYDEQPINFRTSFLQRIRWIKGFIESRYKYIPLIKKSINKTNKNIGSKISICIGVWPYVLMVIGIVLLLIELIIDKNIKLIIIFLLLVYLVLILFTTIMIIKERGVLNLSFKMKLKSIFYNPIFLLTYVPCALTALFKKEVKWDKIEHVTETIQF